MRGQVFTKQFEDDYNLSRELALLTDLSQRAGPVPRVIATDHRGLRLSMENRGRSLNDWLPTLTDRQVMNGVSKAVEAVWAIGRLGVCHIDVAARNILFENHWLATAQIIDFNAALCHRFPLQKPLWILPNPLSHHPVLSEAIVEDWRGFFEVLGICPPSSPYQPFDIPWEQYRLYWPERLHCNEILDTVNRILAYGLAGLLIEVSRGRTEPTCSQLEEQADFLRSCKSERQAQTAIAQLMKILSSDSVTPVPKFQQIRSLTDLPASSLEQRRARRRFLYRLRKIGVLACGIAALTLTDWVYETRSVKLGDQAFYAVLMVMPVLMLLAWSLARSGSRLWHMILYGVFMAAHMVLLIELVSAVGVVTAILPIVPSLLGAVLVLSPPKAPTAIS